MKISFLPFSTALVFGSAALPLCAQDALPAAPAVQVPAVAGQALFAGVQIVSVPGELRDHLPILGAGVGLLLREPGSLAAAGLARADVLVGWNGVDLKDPAQFETLAAKVRPGEKVEICYLRRGEMAELTLSFDEPATENAGKPAKEARRKDLHRIGDFLRDLKPEDIVRELDRQGMLDGLDLERQLDRIDLDKTLEQAAKALHDLNPEARLRELRGKLGELDLDNRVEELEKALRELKLRGKLRELKLEERVEELESTLRELDLENRIKQTREILKALNLEGMGKDGILGAFRELGGKEKPREAQPEGGPGAENNAALPGLLRQIDPRALRDAAEALDIEGLDPRLVEGAFRGLRQGAVDSEGLSKMAKEFGIENVDPKMIDEAVKGIDPEMINGLLEEFRRRAGKLREKTD